MFGSSYKVARVWGIPIKVHISLLLIVFMFMFRHGFWLGIAAELGLALSIVMHELGHSLVAMKYGCRVREITLMCIGGAAQMEEMPRRPLAEFLMALAGPAVSFVIGFTILFVPGPWQLLPGVRSMGGYNVIEYVGLINLVLLVFNLIPAFPMDGGRVLRALLTPKLGRLRATGVAVRVGKIIAVLFGIYGWRSGNWFLVFIAFFIYAVGGVEYRMVQMQEGGNRRRNAWWPGSPPPPPPPRLDDREDGDDVIISPPPYRKGPNERTDIHQEW